VVVVQLNLIAAWSNEFLREYGGELLTDLRARTRASLAVPSIQVHEVRDCGLRGYHDQSRRNGCTRKV